MGGGGGGYFKFSVVMDTGHGLLNSGLRNNSTIVEDLKVLSDGGTGLLKHLLVGVEEEDSVAIAGKLPCNGADRNKLINFI